MNKASLFLKRYMLLNLSMHSFLRDEALCPQLHVNIFGQKYLHEAGDIEPHLAGSYACSGLTAYSALKKGLPYSSDNKAIILGVGGVGMMGLQIAKSAFNVNPIVIDVDDEKLRVQGYKVFPEAVQAYYHPQD